MKNFISNIFSSCLGSLLALLALILIGSALGALFIKEGTEGTSVLDNSIIKLDLSGPIPEQSNNIPMDFSSFKNETTLGLRDIVKTIEKASKDAKIKGIYIPDQNIQTGYASLNEIRNALIKFKENGKFIISYAYSLNHKNYYILSVSDQIIFHPLGFIDLRGFSLTVPHFKELTDKLGIDFNIYYAGEFKSATEPFRMNKMSDNNRLQLREYLNDILTKYTEEIAASRKIDIKEVQTNFNQFLSYTPALAKEHSLIDEMGSETDALNQIRKKLNVDENTKFNQVTLLDYYLYSKDQNEDFSSSNRIALLYAEGNIIEDPGQEGEIGRKYLKTLRDIRNTKSIKALVLRVNSPGGSALLSDEILEEIKLIKASGKPVVVSMGEYAASGGYYISCHADSIFCNPYTLTGSIGVFALIPNFNKLSGDKIGIDFDTVGTGAYANKFSMALPWGDAEKKIMEENINTVYQRFTTIVAEGRKIPLDTVKNIARGRIYSGKRSIELNLTNKTATLDEAIQCAARLASLEKYRVSEFPSQKDPIQKFIETIKGEKDVQSQMLHSALQKDLNVFTPALKELNYWKNARGSQMRLPVYLQ